ncbi:predicted protein [Postia placenta Mad-698-R]|nr:predicted protein [Postia placenta Mad-698-R]
MSCTLDTGGIVAIVGIAAELPSGPACPSNLDYHVFCRLLLKKGKAYQTIPVERFNIHGIKGKGLGQVVTDTGAFLKAVESFDYMEFGITNKDATSMALSTRKLIETSFLSLVDSGIDYRGKNIGCYMSGVAHDSVSVAGHEDADKQGSFGFAPAMVANRVSYHLDLRGPSVALDTACSSSLYAMHLAVQALRNAECEAALVGGCQINHRMAEWLAYTQGGVLSSDGECKPFDANADGFGRGEGAIVVVLKTLQNALKDNDKIYSTVRSSQQIRAILNGRIDSRNRRSLGPVNAAVASAQKNAMLRAFAQAGRRPCDVDYVELHATGTAQGDPTESNWVGETFQRERELIIGSVKGNIGHLEIAAFLASLCKVCLMVRTRLIPPTANLLVPNPSIQWGKYNLRVATEVEPLPCFAPNGRHLISLASSGIGGANGHCVVEGPPSERRRSPRIWKSERPPPWLLVASGLSPKSAIAVQDLLCQTDPRDHGALSRIYGRRSRSMFWRSYALSNDGQLSSFSPATLAPKEKPPLVFVFSGQGSQHYETGLFTENQQERDLGNPWSIETTLPALTIFQLALYETLLRLGIRPHIVLGHSAGDTAVLAASSMGSRAMAIEIAIARGKAMARLDKEGGTMAALACSVETVLQLITSDTEQGSMEIACYNSPSAVTISGHASRVHSVVRAASEIGIFARVLRTRTPVHSSLMEACHEEYRRLVAEVFSRHSRSAPVITTYSSYTGVQTNTSFDADYFWDSARGPVQFSTAIHAILETAPNAIFVEVGPHPVLCTYISSMSGDTHRALSPTKRTEKGEECYNLIDFLGQLVVAGYTGIDFDALGCAGDPDVDVPPFPLSRREVPYLAPTPEAIRQRQERNGPLNYPQLRINSRTHPALAEHIIKNEPTMPAAGYIEMTGRSMLLFNWRAVDGASAVRRLWILRRNGRLRAHEFVGNNDEVDLEKIRARLKRVNMKDFYRGFSFFANYGPTYQRVTSCLRGVDIYGRSEALVEVRGIDDDLPGAETYRIHPAILDAALHIMVHPNFNGCNDKHRYYLSSTCGSFTLHNMVLSEPFPRTVFAHVVMTQWFPDSITYECLLIKEDGTPLCTLQDMTCALHGHGEPLMQRFQLVYAPTDVPLSAALGVLESEDQDIRQCTKRYTLQPVSHEGLAVPLDTGSLDDGIVTFSSDSTDLLIHYRRGEEISLQKILRSLDPLAPSALWLIASDDLDGYACLGLARSLRKEYRAWALYTVLFDRVWTRRHRAKAIETLMTRGRLSEVEMIISADGVVTSPKILPLPQTTRSTEFNPALPWKLENSQISHITLPPPANDYVTVRVIAVTTAYGSLQGFVGCVAGVDDEASVDSQEYATKNKALSVVACVVAALAVGVASFSHPQRLKQTKILVDEGDGDLCHQIIEIIVTGVTDDSLLSVYKEMAGSHSSVFAWRHPQTGVARVIETDPCAIGDALNASLPYTGMTELYTQPLLLVDHIPPEVPLRTDLFERSKSYLLIGGVGSLGVHIAAWMHQNGAREIVLTSRSDRQGLTRKGDYLSQAILRYLEKLPDLTLRTRRADALSEEDMRGLVQSLKHPLGGCFILTAILIDHTFAMLTQAEFDSPFKAKDEVFGTLKKIVPIESLDFLIAFSSVSGLFGNAGQTNYAAANTALSGMLQEYKNATSFICPIITDAGVFLTQSGDSYMSRIRHLSDWGMSCRDLCAYIEDVILRLRDGPVWQYIPAFDWNAVSASMGPSSMYNHIVDASALDVQGQPAPDKAEGLRDIVSRLLDIASEDLSLDVPLTAYGLDSLTAASLSFALRDLLPISQIQLLSGMTLANLLTLLSARLAQNPSSTTASTTDSHGIRECHHKVREMTQLVHKYGTFPRREMPLTSTKSRSQKVVLVTGVTGRVGAHVLKELLEDTDVEPQIERTITHVIHLERPIEDASVAVGSGYSESKWVAERLVLEATAQHCIMGTVIRIGQMSGAANGCWKTSEWIPALVSASSALGCVPDGTGEVSWLPVHVGAAALVEMLDSEEPVLHLRHPHPVHWSDIMQCIAVSLKVPMVPYQEWIGLLEGSLMQPMDRGVEVYLEPAIRILDWLRLGVQSTKNADHRRDNNGLSFTMAIDLGCAASTTLRDSVLTPLGPTDVDRWMRFWRINGAIVS